MTGVAIILAVLAAACFATAAVLQHRAINTAAVLQHRGESTAPVPSADTSQVTGRANRCTLSQLAQVLRRPAWLAGLGLGGLGAGLHALALVLAPLSVVQPIGVVAVPLAVLISALVGRGGPRVTPGVIVGVILTVTGVVGFVGQTAGISTTVPVSGAAIGTAGLGAGLVAVALAACAVMARGRWGCCVSAAAAAAVAFGLVSALVRAISQALTSGTDIATVPLVAGMAAGIVVALAGGGWLVQQAFVSGPPALVVACLTVGDPIVAVGLGVLLLGEGAAIAAGTWPLLAVCVGLAVAGVVALARYHPEAATRQLTVGPTPAPRLSTITQSLEGNHS